MQTSGGNNEGETDQQQAPGEVNENTETEIPDETSEINLETDIELDFTSGDVSSRIHNLKDQIQEENIDLEEEQIAYKTELQEIWRRNFNKYIEMEIEQREFTTKSTPPPEKKHLNILNTILSVP